MDSTKNKNILIAGGSGLIGRSLSEYLSLKGYTISVLSRNTKNSKYMTYLWNPERGEVDLSAFINQNYVINLTGAGIADKYWTAKRKDVLIKSRTSSIDLIAKGLASSNSKPKKIIQASAIGFYGSKPGEKITEESAHGKGYLSEVCIKWEDRASQKYQTPYAIARIGIVLSDKGGYLAKMRGMLKKRINLILGTGKQYISWIHIDDLIKAFHYLLITDASTGVYNIVSEAPVTSIEMQSTLSNQFKRKPFGFTLNEKLVKFAFGNFSEIFLVDQQVIPKKLQLENFIFEYPKLDKALESLFTP